MKTRTLWVAALGVVLLASSVMVASNMGFKVNRTLQGRDTDPGDGVSLVSLPYNRQVGIDDAGALRADINTTFGGTTVVSIADFITSSNGFTTYTGSSQATNFNLEAGKAYRIQVSDLTNYIIVGSHAPGLPITLLGRDTDPGDGVTLYSPPYHTTSANAGDLRTEFNNAGGGVVSIAQFVTTSNGFTTYTGSSQATNFALTPGEGYRIQLANGVTFTPEHY